MFGVKYPDMEHLPYSIAIAFRMKSVIFFKRTIFLKSEVISFKFQHIPYLHKGFKLLFAHISFAQLNLKLKYYIGLLFALSFPITFCNTSLLITYRI